MVRITAERTTISRGLVGSSVYGLNVNDWIDEPEEARSETRSSLS
jgi:hypothetical protein